MYRTEARHITRPNLLVLLAAALAALVTTVLVVRLLRSFGVDLDAVYMGGLPLIY